MDTWDNNFDERLLRRHGYGKTRGKDYLRHIVSEVRIKGNQAEITGSRAALAYAVAQMKTSPSLEVLAFVHVWLGDFGVGEFPRRAGEFARGL
jgi:hypothetical protein